jgi:hypothetical protein
MGKEQAELAIEQRSCAPGLGLRRGLHQGKAVVTMNSIGGSALAEGLITTTATAATICRERALR